MLTCFESSKSITKAKLHNFKGPNCPGSKPRPLLKSYLLRVLRLSGTRLASDENRLVDAVVVHGLVRALSNGKDVRPALGPSVAHVQLHGGQGVDGEPLVRVDGDTEEAGVGVDQLVHITDAGVPENAGISEVGEVCHVLRAVELGRVHLANLLDLVVLHLAVDVDVQLGALGLPVSHHHVLLDETLQVAALFALVDNPAGPLHVVRLLEELGLQLLLHLQPWGGVRVGSAGLLDVAGHLGRSVSPAKVLEQETSTT